MTCLIVISHLVQGQVKKMSDVWNAKKLYCLKCILSIPNPELPSHEIKTFNGYHASPMAISIAQTAFLWPWAPGCEEPDCTAAATESCSY